MRNFRFWWLLATVLALLSACSKEPSPDGGGAGGGESEKDITVKGKVLDYNGKGLPGVVVSDGYKCVETNSSGEYRLASDLAAVKFISVSIPRGYKVASKGGLPLFYKRLSEESLTNGIYQNLNFRLEKPVGDPDRCTLIVAADPQSRASSAAYDNIGFHSLECQKDVYEDMGDYAAGISGREVYGVMLGDLVHENMNLYANYVNDLGRTGFASFSIIGNHDHNTKGVDDADGAAVYEQYLGPTNYSFNLGMFHFVMLDDMIMYPDATGALKSYNTGLTDATLEWLKQDLRFVDTSTPIMVCAHSPMFRLKGGSERFNSNNTVNGKKYAEIFAKYEHVYAWAGHTHSAFNYAASSGTCPNVESHTLTRCTGELWTNENIQEDGFPRSYVVVEINGGSISWKMKPVDRETGKNVARTTDFVWYPFTREDSGALFRGASRVDDKYQIHAYPRGSYGDNYVYANVLMYDEKWGKVEFIDSNGATTVMTRVTDKTLKYDLSYKESFEWYTAHAAQFADRTFSTETAESIFRCYSSLKTGSGYVQATDRFGNIFKSDVINW